MKDGKTFIKNLFLQVVFPLVVFLLSGGCTSSLTQQYIGRAQGEYLKGNLKEAIAYYTKAIDIDPANAKLYFDRALYKQFSGNTSGAISDYTKALELNLNPDLRYFAFTNLGGLYRQTEEYERAIGAYTKAIETVPSNATWWHFYNNYFGRSKCYALNNDLERSALDRKKAKEFLQAQERFRPGIQNELLSAFVGGVIGGSVGAATGQPPMSSTEITTSLAFSNATERILSDEQGKIKNVERAEVSVTDTDYAEVYELRAGYYFQMKKHDKAVADYTQAIELAPVGDVAVNAYIGRAGIFATCGERDRAASDLARVDELLLKSTSPDKFVAYARLGRVYAAMGNQDEAISYYNKAMEIAPPMAKTYFDRWFVCGKRDILLWRGEAYSNKSDYDRAIADYTRAIDKKSTGGPVYGESYYRRALAYYAKGDYNRARSDVDQALKYKYPVNSDFITKVRRISK